MSEYHPFKSAETKERWIRHIHDLEKTTWPVDSDSVYVDTSFGKTFVRICGPESAPPLVLLHGMGANSLMWAGSIKPFSDKYRAYAVDAVDDFGLSVNTKLLKDADDYSQWLDALFTGLGLDNNINLMGLSYGGWQAGQYALRHQEKLNKVVLLSPAGTVLPIKKVFYLRGALTMLPFKFCRGNLLSWALEDLKKQDEELFEKTVLYQNEMAMECFKSPQARTWPSVLSDHEWQSLKVPVLFLTGANEKIYSPRKAMERLERVAPSIKKKLIPGGGHDLFAVKMEIVNSHILEFLEN